jgi:hypothetical protein
VTAACDTGENVTGEDENVTGCHRVNRQTCDTRGTLILLGIFAFVTGVTGYLLLIILRKIK